MQVEITARHCELPEAVKERVETRMERLRRFSERIVDARVVVSLEKNRFSAEAIIKANGMRLISHAEEDTHKAALESVLDRLEGQVRRHRDRMVKKNRRSTSGGQLSSELIALGTAETPTETEASEGYDAFRDDSDYEGLVNEDPGDIGVAMGLGEAVALLRASRRDVLGFTSIVTSRPTIIFKRRDGNIGIVDVDL